MFFQIMEVMTIGAPAARTLEQSMRDALLVRLAASAYVMDSVNL